LVLAEIVQHHAEPAPQVGAREMLPVFGPVAPGHVVEPQRRARALGLRDVLLRPLALGSLYRFGFAARGLFRRAEKDMTSDLESIWPERRRRVAADGHGESFRVWFLMKSSSSASVNITRRRLRPCPIRT